MASRKPSRGRHTAPERHRPARLPEDKDNDYRRISIPNAGTTVNMRQSDESGAVSILPDQGPARTPRDDPIIEYAVVHGEDDALAGLASGIVGTNHTPGTDTGVTLHTHDPGIQVIDQATPSLIGMYHILLSSSSIVISSGMVMLRSGTNSFLKLRLAERQRVSYKRLLFHRIEYYA